MTVTETLIRKIIDLPEERLWKVLTFVEHLELEPSGKQQLPIDLYGLCADIRSELSFEEFQKNRQEMWGESTDREVQSNKIAKIDWYGVSQKQNLRKKEQVLMP